MNDTGNENKAASEADLKALAQAYLDAFDAQDLDRCLGFFSDDATIDFNKTVYNGRQAVADWHKDRFAANLKLVRLNNISVTLTLFFNGFYHRTSHSICQSASFS